MSTRKWQLLSAKTPLYGGCGRIPQPLQVVAVQSRANRPANILTYLRNPKRISLTESPFSEYTDMPVATHLEIVKLAAELYLENKANPRYQSYVNEVSTME